MKKAFTLIELLVVIAIIAILAAILFPVFAQAKAAAKKTSDLSNIKQLSLGILMYSGDNDDVLPSAYFHRAFNPALGGTAGGYEHWSGLTYPYVKNWEIFEPWRFTSRTRPDMLCFREQQQWEGLAGRSTG